MRESSYWLLFILAGIIIFIFGTIHMLITHMSSLFYVFNPFGTHAIMWENVVFRSNLYFMKFLYIILLLTTLYHGFFGIKILLSELNINNILEEYLILTLIISGSILFIIGTTSIFIGTSYS